jgi:hypothetical protein
MRRNLELISETKLEVCHQRDGTYRDISVAVVHTFPHSMLVYSDHKTYGCKTNRIADVRHKTMLHGQVLVPEKL